MSVQESCASQRRDSRWGARRRGVPIEDQPGMSGCYRGRKIYACVRGGFVVFVVVAPRGSNEVGAF